ncbi:hypothetical protein TFLX_02345 [Thermoflexales bacterium]|nr:hypothetical protein TFLX_02345 [Thermoflexales bacterium]
MNTRTTFRLTLTAILAGLFMMLSLSMASTSQGRPASIPRSAHTGEAIPVLIKDINTADRGSQAGPKIIMNGIAYFAAYDGIHGRELWRSDGTSAGTWQVKDIFPGSSSSAPEQIVRVNNRLFFVANDGVHGQELWASDGTSAGTSLAADLTPGTLHTGISQGTAVSDTLFFHIDSYPHGSKLWKSDGTVTGTVPLSYYQPSGLINVAGWLYYAAMGPDLSTFGLWKTDGTSQGTFLLGQFPATDNARPSELTNVKGTVFFKAAQEDPQLGYQYGLWKSDGTVSGTVVVTNVGLYNLAAVEDMLFFTASVGDGSRYLEKTDGTLTGTTVLTHLSSIAQLTNVSGTLYFVAAGMIYPELWKSDGTALGTVMVKGGFDYSWCNSFPPCGISNLTAIHDKLYFNSSDGNSHGAELWVSDGTSDGTIQVVDIYPGSLSSYPESFADLNSSLIFTAEDGQHGPEVWKSGGTPANTQMVSNIFTGTGHGSPYGFFNVGGTVYFGASDSHGVEVWKTNGTLESTALVTDIYPGGSALPSNFASVSGTLLFWAYDFPGSLGLWQSDGTSSGTVLVKDFAYEYSAPRSVVVSNTLFFAANDESQAGLWKSDGTSGGTQLVREIGGYSNYYRLKVMTDLNDMLIFANTWPEVESGLWRSDGTYTGTQLVKHFEAGPGYYAKLNGLLYFTNGGQLWSTDGTETGTLFITNISTETAQVNSDLVPMGGQLFFVAYDPTHRWALWKSDGTPTGTVVLKDQFWGGGGSYPRYLTAVNDTLFFQAGESQHGYELWKSDGTFTGTVIVKDIAVPNSISDPNSSYPSELTAANNKLYFVADDGSHGKELWVSNGEADDTKLVADLYPGLIGSAPNSLAWANDTLYFSAGDIMLGRELWKLNVTPYHSYLPLVLR